ncbi:MAG TPA: hypothetical protein VKE50_06560, partial [Thermoanaerobaculia bacterium]|nr:hypothetical protein [Thermoanaerobaculia bacterium]
AEELRFTRSAKDVLARHNGAKLFGGAMSLYGVARNHLNRRDSFSLPPFNIEHENEGWSHEKARFLVVGGYSATGLRVCVDRSTDEATAFSRDGATAVARWGNISDWLRDEIARLWLLFEVDGRRKDTSGSLEPAQCQ